MATVRLRTTSLLLILLFVVENSLTASPPWIFDVKVNNSTCNQATCVYNVTVFGKYRLWSLTSEPGCYKTDHINFVGEEVLMRVDKLVKLYFCAKSDEESGWLPQDVFLEGGDVIRYDRTSENEVEDSPREELTDLYEDDEAKNYYRDLDVNRDGDEVDAMAVEMFSYTNPGDRRRLRRQAEGDSSKPDNTTEDANAKNPPNNETAQNVSEASSGPVIEGSTKLRVMGLRVEEAAKEPKLVEEMIPSVLTETTFHLRLFGEGFTNDTVIAFTHHAAKYGTPCYHLLNGEYEISVADRESGLFKLEAPPPIEGYLFYVCAKSSPNEDFVHQGSERWKILGTHNKMLPLWASLILIVILLMLASLFSGLNLGLMALDRTELKIIANTGTEKERKYARAIMPVRSHGNYLLCTILLSNVAVNSTFTVILDDLTSGLVAVIGSTLAIVFIAEITPQAICARHGLFIGAKSIWIMKIVMGICAPLAWPTSKLLDYFLGEEIGTHYNRERLKELVKITNHVNDLDKEEVQIISGALDLHKKTVRDVMTKLKDCYMLPIDSILDFETMTEIVKSGYSRIPVYEGHRGNIVTVLFIKDLAFVDPDDNTPLRTLCQYYQNQVNFVFEDVTLDVMLKQFKDGHKGHMAFAQRIDKEGDGDPVYETVGLITLEDVIEEMIQAEIVDESDVISDNRTKKRLLRPMNKLHDIAAFAGHQHQRVHVSPQLILATFQFLSTSVDPFRPDMISETVLRRLLKQDVIQHIKDRADKDKNDPKRYVFQEGKPVDYFVLILEGRVEVTVGRENLVFEAGPFTYFGVQALTQNVGLAESPAPSTLGSLQNLNMDSMLRHTFVPDYSVRAIAEVYYLTIKRSLYLAAKRATLMEKGALNKGGTNEQIEPEVDKLLRDGDRLDDIIENQTQKTPPKQLLPASASPVTNSTFKSYDKGEPNPEEQKLLTP
ncbi:unextended protein-like isoform X2 [Maniola jurtina]|uniref:unextended protein-like isoform X2 n=1 Tax=Maniola jurtina TaxID=191418 RepID=UPI001E68AE13|nr:unextended protein-like isoform X2 [Maniola jurtina]